MINSQNIANENSEPSETSGVSADPAIAPTPEALLQEEIARLTEELEKARDQRIRAIAETDNIRKRSQRDLEENSRYAITGFARDMVSVLENLKRASESIPQQARTENPLLNTLGEGVDLTLKELLSIFQNNGISRVDPMGGKFDHNLHQAVAQVERDDVPAGTVIQVVQAGYVIHDRLLQPAMVVVSKQGEAPKKVDTLA